MFMHETVVRVRYGETDRMGYMYYGNYPSLLEVARVEALRTLGFPYKQLEEDGIMLPVRDLTVRYHRPVHYDEQITIRTRITAMPGASVHFTYELFNEAGTLVSEASTTLVFVGSEGRRPRRAPEALLQALAPYFP